MPSTSRAGRGQFARVERNLLQAPVIHIRDEQDVLRRASDPMHPIELAKLVPRFSEPTQNLAIFRIDLINPARLLVGNVKVLWRGSGHAQGPGRGDIRWILRDVS